MNYAAYTRLTLACSHPASCAAYGSYAVSGGIQYQYNVPCLVTFCKRFIVRVCDMQSGILEKYNCELIGAKLPSIDRAEDRNLFKNAMAEIGLKTPPSGIASTMEEAIGVLDHIGKFPVIIRPAFTLGGTGGGIAYNMDEYKDIIEQGLTASVTSQVQQRSAPCCA